MKEDLGQGISEQSTNQLETITVMTDDFSEYRQRIQSFDYISQEQSVQGESINDNNTPLFIQDAEFDSPGLNKTNSSCHPIFLDRTFSNQSLTQVQYSQKIMYQKTYQQASNWKTQLQQGNYFVKHHRWGKPKLRILWVDTKLEELLWREPKDSEENFKGSIKISGITEIKDGLVKNKQKKTQ